MKNNNKKLYRALLVLVLGTLLQGCIGSEPAPDIEDCAAPVSNPIANNVDNKNSSAPLHVDGLHIKDTDGRVVILRGVNTSGDSKVPPFTPITSGSMLDPLPGWGINTLRLLFTWEAFEPERCDYEESYLQYYENVVQWAEERDIYVIVDFHQDAFSRFSVGGCGEGFPKWAITSTVTPKEPDNGESCESWGSRMIFDFAHHQSWAYFHKDLEKVKTRYVDMVTAVAQRMSSHKNVIGYELINEPWGTNEELADLYNAVGLAIRSQHPDSILFVPPHALVSSGGLSNNIPKPIFDNFIYSPHYYDPFVILSSMWLGTDPAKPLDKMAEKAKQWGVPLLIGEYGAPANTVNVEGYMNAYNNWLNQGLHSATQWNYTPTWQEDTKDGWNHEDLSITDDTGKLRKNFIPRPYPQSISGTPLYFYTDKSLMEFRWINAPSTGITEIYIPQSYTEGKEVKIADGVNCQFHLSRLNCSSQKEGEVFVKIQ